MSIDMADKAALLATAKIISSYAVGFSTSPATAAAVSSRVDLPGRDTSAKRILEAELLKLAFRISQLENRVSTSVSRDLPETPDEQSISLFDGESDLDQAAVSKPNAMHIHQDGLDCLATKPSQLANKSLSCPQELTDSQLPPPSANDLEADNLDGLIPAQENLSDKPTIAALQTELQKHQKANQAFQRALLEIGEVVTAVARGDLTMKVPMDTIEMDPEITTFKRTINITMNRLQIFASEVSRVAREVGTEGLLGGQACIGGVDGTWKELTDNGKLSCPFFYTFARIVRYLMLIFSKYHGPESHRSR